MDLRAGNESWSFPQKAPEILQPPHTPTLKDRGKTSSHAHTHSPADSKDEMQPMESTRNPMDEFLLFLVRAALEDVQPRKTTGTVLVWKSGSVICVHETDHLPDVFQKMVVEGISAVPVLNAKHKYVGMVDLLSMVVFTTGLFAELTFEQSKLGWAEFFSKEARFRSATVRDVMIKRPLLPRSTEGYAVLQGFSLLHAYELLARTRDRRVPVINEKNEIVGLVTQSMLISLIKRNINRLGQLANVQVREFRKSLPDKVEAVRENSKAIDAFRIMAEKNVTGLAVVNSRGVLIDTITTRDLRAIGTDADKYHRLWYDVNFFKELTRQEFKHQTPSKPLWVSEDDTLHRVIDLMDDGNIHRIWVCELKPTGLGPLPVSVISQRDVLRIMLEACGV